MTIRDRFRRLLERSVSRSDASDEIQDQRLFYHGTDLASARSLLHGSPLDIAAARARTNGAPLGFYFATSSIDAEVFAMIQMGPEGAAVLQYSMTNVALSSLMGKGAVVGPIPQAGFPGRFHGQQVYLPPSAFQTFNSLRNAGGITVVPFRGRENVDD